MDSLSCDQEFFPLPDAFFPQMVQRVRWLSPPDSDQPPCVSVVFLWEASLRAAIPAFDSVFAVEQECDVNVELEPEGREFLCGYRV